jgi:uncharacterized protein (DUF1501 family)
MNKLERSRRHFLRTASMASMAGMYASPFLLELNSWPPWRREPAHPAIKALVCVFLQGGNDGHGAVIATDPDSFSAFTSGAVGCAGTRVSDSQICSLSP